MASARVGHLSVLLSLNSSKFSKGVTAAQKQMVMLTSAVTKAGNAIVTRLIAPMAGLVAGGALVRFATQLMSELDALAKTSDKLGISTEALAGFHRAAERTGMEVRTFDMALQRMTRRVSEAAIGTGEAQGALKELGVDAARLMRLAPEQQMYTLANAMARVQSSADRVRLAFKLFDSEGVAMVNMLRDGGDALRQMVARNKELGFSFSRQQLKNIEEVNDALADYGLIMKGKLSTVLVDATENVNLLNKQLGLVKPNEGLVQLHKKIADIGSGLQYIKDLGGLASLVVHAMPASIEAQEKALSYVAPPPEVLAGRAAQENAIAMAQAAAAKTAEEAAKKIESMVNVAERSYMAFTHGADALQLYDLQLAGASNETVLYVQRLQMMQTAVARLREEEDQRNQVLKTMRERADAIYNATRTPTEKAQEEIRELQSLLNSGMIDFDTFSRGARASMERMRLQEDRTGAFPGTAQQIIASRTAFGIEQKSRGKQEVTDLTVAELLREVRDLLAGGLPARAA